MKALRLFTYAVVCLLITAGLANAQGVGASGEIKGTVTDPNGAVVQHATVTAENTQTGLKRSTVTDADGSYRLPNLLPAVYRVTAEGQGFAISSRDGVTVTVGETVNADFQMQVTSAQGRVDITTEPPAVDTQRGSQANTINQKYITSLPINRRDYLTFTLLMPGVSDSTRLSSDQDFRVKQTPQSGLSFYGSNGRGNSVTVDGGEVDDDAGGVRLNLGQDAVQEFQVNRSNYTAELGGASGASINIVSRSGSNNWHGSAFGLFRTHHLDARNPFSFTNALQPGQTFNPALPDVTGQPVKDHLSREQFGASAGFPIKTDKTFGYVSFEGLIQNAQNSVPLLTNTNIFRPQNTANNNQVAVISGLAGLGATPVPCLTGQPALPANVCAGILNNVLTVNPASSPLSAFLVNQFETNGGLFDYKTRTYYASGRIDHTFSDRNQVYLRYSFAHDREENPDVRALTGFSRGSSIHAWDSTVQGTWFHQFDPRMSNEMRGQWSLGHFDVIPNVTGQAGLDLPGFATFGTNIFLPNFTKTNRFEFADNFTANWGAHTVKIGGAQLLRGNTTESQTFFPGRFVFGSLPGGVLSPCLQVPAACGLVNVNPATINSLQSGALGLPQFYQQGFGDPHYSNNRPFTSIYGQDTWAIRPNFTVNFGVRYELDLQYGNLRTDDNNLAPRVSFTWDPFKDHKTVIRGGWGKFYSQVYAQIPNVVQTLGVVNGFRQIAQTFVSLRGGIPGNPTLTSATVFQTLFAQGKVQCNTPAAGQFACITPADLTQFGLSITHTGPIPPFSVIFSGQHFYSNPYAYQGGIGIEREVTKGLTVSANYIYVHTLKLPVAIDINLIPAPVTTAALPNGQLVSFRNWAAPQCGANPFACFVNPLILQANQYSSAGVALYQGGTLEVRQRFNRRISIFGNYTYSKAHDTVTDFNSDYGPADQTNLDAERALSNFDQRHKVVIAGVFSSTSANAFLNNWELSPIFRYNSGHPFNLLAGADVNGDRHSTNDRPLGVPRNTGLGPNYADFDLRLARRFRLTEKTSLQVISESFNLFNRTNFASVNNVVGTAINPPFNLHGSSTLLPSTPLGFTSVVQMRQIQLGARLEF